MCEVNKSIIKNSNTFFFFIYILYKIYNYVIAEYDQMFLW